MNIMKSKLNINRRGFLKSSLIGSAGALIGAPAYSASGMKIIQEPLVIRRRLGKTDIELPVVSFGVMRSDNANLVRSAYKMGFVHFDTANGYQEGRNETMLGEIFRDYPRDSFVLATKVSPDNIDRRTGEVGPGSARDSILAKFETSLNRLQFKYVDILYLHGVSQRGTALHPEILETFESLKKQGKVRYIGMSTHSNEPEVIQAAVDSKAYDVVLTSYNFKQEHAEAVKEKIELAAKSGVGIIAMKTMAGAFMDKEKQHPINCKSALKWVLQDTNVCTSIPGIVSYDMMIENFSVMEKLEFTEKEKADLNEARLLAGLYCDGCKQCIPQCKKHLPVNEIMRAYMYAYGYRHFENAYALLDDIKISVDPCGDCSACSIQCPKGFMVKNRVQDIARLVDIPRDLFA
jgi:predicted aldo/keto reductase-like oxidoreductase